MKFDPSDKDKQFIITATEVKHTYQPNPDYRPPAKPKSWFHWSLIPIIILVLVLAEG
ncbi:MAG: hypothetical protein AAGD25_04210 [Cyanobacteria bacterium P01_F01_bin.150]